MKPMTFEEWDFEFNGNDNRDETEMIRRGWFNAARIGMIPEDGAIRIPPEKEWPEDALAIKVEYVTKARLAAISPWEIKIIPRSKPAWAPKVGEAVFMDDRDQSGHILVGVVASFNGDGYAMVGTPDTHWYLDYLKPFNPAYIGKPWSEIPEGK